jgi:sulfide:quinone oxidoreductase
MDIRPVTKAFAVSPQIEPTDMDALASQGFTAVICNRPDGEEALQPTSDAMSEAAQKAGLAYYYIPMSGGQFTDADVAAFRAVRTAATGPVLAYCRTGTRSITLEALANPDRLTPSELLQQARDAGYDIAAIADRLGC